MSYLILSLDGGGIRGVLTAQLLAQLEQAVPFIQDAKLVAGTSTGGILALGIAHGLKPKQLVNLYKDNAERIFGRRDLWDTLAVKADELYRADYGTEGLQGVLEDTFGDKRLKELAKTVLIPTFDLDAPATDERVRQWKPKFLHNFNRTGNDGDVRCVDAALRTSAAPTYFPSYQGYIDGGVVANDPSACAVAAAVKGEVPLGEIRVLSVGTGFYPHFIAGDSHDWGKGQWGLRILNLVLEGTLGVAGYQCKQLLGERFFRLQVELEKPIDLDAIDRVDDLIAIGKACDVSAAEKFLKGP